MNDDIIKAQYLIATTVSIFTNSIKDMVTETVSGVWYNIQDDLRKMISLYK